MAHVNLKSIDDAPRHRCVLDVENLVLSGDEYVSEAEEVNQHTSFQSSVVEACGDGEEDDTEYLDAMQEIHTKKTNIVTEIVNGVECEYEVTVDEDEEEEHIKKTKVVTEIVNGVECEYEVTDDENEGEQHLKKTKIVTEIVNGVECEYEVTDNESEYSNEYHSSSSSEYDASEPEDEEELEHTGDAMSNLARVARMHMASISSHSLQYSRIQEAVQSQCAGTLLHTLICEVADGFLQKLDSTIGDTVEWRKFTGSSYLPGSVCNWNSRENGALAEVWLDVFLQSTCGWPDDSIAIGPVMVAVEDAQTSRLVTDADNNGTEMHHELDTWEQFCGLPPNEINCERSRQSLDEKDTVVVFGTIQQPRSLHRLPVCNVTAAMKSLGLTLGAFDDSVGRKPWSTMVTSSNSLTQLVLVVERAVERISKVTMGDGPVKQPTEEQLHYMGRLIGSVEEAFYNIEDNCRQN